MSAYEDYDKASQAYDEGGRDAVCVAEILAQIQPNSSLLDAGCGTGNYMLPLVRSGKLTKYTGFDANSGMLAKSLKKANLLKENPDMKTEIKIEEPLSLLEKLPYEDGVFDVVMHNMVMHHIVLPNEADKFVKVRAYLAEFHRVLKPGGLLTINTWTQEQAAEMWFVKRIPSALKHQTSVFPSMNEFKELLGAFTDVSHHIDHALYRDNFNDYDRCFDEEYRDGDSAWKPATDADLATFLEEMRVILESKEKRAKFDAVVKKEHAAVGITTQLFAKK